VSPTRLITALSILLTLSACGLSISLSVKGEVDCIDDLRWNQIAGFDFSGTGQYPDAEEAVRDGLSMYLEKYGGEIRQVDEDTGSLIVESDEKIVVHVLQLPLGGWEIESVHGCGSETEPLSR
jgi:hypothetical protein